MRLLLIVALLACVTPVAANDTTAELGTGGLVFVTTDELKMESEDLFVSPEQVKGEECTQRADVFSAGVIAAELLMGRPLFSGGSELAVLLAIRDAKIHPFLEAAARLPPGIGAVITSALSANPEERVASAGALRKQLEAFGSDDESELSRELADLVTRANQDTFSVINKRVAEGMDEVRSLMAKAADGKPDPKA